MSSQELLPVALCGIPSLALDTLLPDMHLAKTLRGPSLHMSRVLSLWSDILPANLSPELPEPSAPFSQLGENTDLS